MTDLTNYNARRQQRQQARVNELMDLLRDEPQMTRAEVLHTLCKRWKVSEDTVKVTWQFALRKKIITSKTVWHVSDAR